MAIEVQTTQNVTIDYEPAGLGYRMLAYIIDWIIMFVWVLGWVGIIYLIFGAGFYNVFDSTSFSILLLIGVVFPIVFYDLLFETLNHGQSPGKMLFKIRVVNVDGTTPSFGGYLLRWLFRIVDFQVFYGTVAIISVVITKKSQRLGDLIAGTTVIDLKLKYHLRLPELDFHEDYKVKYYDVLDRLSDRDIQTIRSILEDSKMKGNASFTYKLTQRIKQITEYEYDGDDNTFLRKIINDYNYLALQQ